MLWVYARPQSMLRADVIWAVTALAAAVMGGGAARSSLAKDPGLSAGDARPFWKEIRPLGLWATVGATIYWVYSQRYNYVLASRVNLTAVADVNAARLLLMPTAATWLAESGIGRLIRRLLVFALGIAALDIAYCVFVWLFRDWLSHDLMLKSIGDRDRLLLLWGSLSLIDLFRDLLQTGLFALRNSRYWRG